MSRKKRKQLTIKHNKADVVVYGAEQDHFSVKSKCYVCESVEDEDMTVLCDGEGCSNEAHMYCLEPIMTELPLGDWLCNFCDEFGSSKNLISYFDFRTNTHQLPLNSIYYNDWLVTLQSKYWKESSYINNTNFCESELHSSEYELIGLLVTLVIDEVIYRCHHGRIINHRLDASCPDRWEHLVQFKRLSHITPN